MEKRTVERYQKLTIWIHWIHAATFVLMVLTGIVMFLPENSLGSSIPGTVHRVMSIAFVGIPVLYSVFKPGQTLSFIKETIHFSRDYVKWLKAAPNYYFGGPEENMPPQGRTNTGQKIWQLVILVASLILLVTGIVLWFFKYQFALETYQWILSIHGIAFILILVMFLVHVYMGILHPRMCESLSSMKDGKISPTYAQKHYAKWYSTISKDR